MNRPFDLAKLDTERIRKQLRRKLLLTSLAPVLVVLLVSFKFLSLSLLSSWGLHAYNKSDYASASNDFKPLLLLNNFEKYKAYFNLGTSLYREGKYPEAQHQLEEALKYVPPEHECDVRLNLGMAIEVQADAKADQKKYDEAIVLYDEAKSVLTANNCAPAANDTNGKDSEQKVQSAKQRVEQKSQNAKRNRNGDKSNGNQSNNSQNQQNDQQPSQSQTQQLEQKATKNQNVRQLRQRQDKINYDKNPGDYDRVVW
jgi:tetratricopeptide (TPR) repeat protein